MTSFEERLARISTQAPAPEPTAEAPARQPMVSGKPHTPLPFFARFALLVLAVPLGFILGFVTQAFLDPEVTPDGVHYRPFLYGLAAAHLVLLGGAVAVLITRFRASWLNWLMLGTLMGYGLAAIVVRTMIG